LSHLSYKYRVGEKKFFFRKLKKSNKINNLIAAIKKVTIIRI